MTNSSIFLFVKYDMVSYCKADCLKFLWHIYLTKSKLNYPLFLPKLSGWSFTVPSWSALIGHLKWNSASIGSNSMFHPMGERGQKTHWNIKLKKSSSYNLWTLNPESEPETLNLEPWTLNLKPWTWNPEPWTWNPEPGTWNPEPGTDYFRYIFIG